MRTHAMRYEFNTQLTAFKTKCGIIVVGRKRISDEPDCKSCLRLLMSPGCVDSNGGGEEATVKQP